MALEVAAPGLQGHAFKPVCSYNVHT
jgi:hypothetical protein